MSEALVNALRNKLKDADDQITDLKIVRNKEIDNFLWEKRCLSRRIALLSFWMDKLFKYANANRNQMTMTTEIPDTLIREGMDYLNRETSECEARPMEKNDD